MPVMDEFKEEREALKHGTWKQKLSYFFDYYKWHVIVGAALLIFGFSLVSQILNHKETAFYAGLLNTIELNNGTNYAQGFAEYAGIDSDTYDILFDTSMNIVAGQLDQETISSTQKLVAIIAAKELDVMITDSASIQGYANSQYFYDLRDLLSPEQVEQYEASFYYVDMTAVLKRQAAMDSFDNDYVPSYPDPRHPEDMEQPIPVGIYLDGENALKDSFYFRSDEVVISVLLNTKHAETTSRFIDFLMQ